MAARNTTRPGSMCCVSIDHRDYLMPSDKGMKLVELLQHAVECQRDYVRSDSNGYRYQAGEQPSVEFCLVKTAQIVAPRVRPLMLEGPKS